MPRISAVIIHYKNISDTEDCLKSLLKSAAADKSKLNIVVVANSDLNITDLSVGNAKNLIKIINPGVNSGFARGNNIGISQALESDCEYILLLNNDAIVPEKFMNNLTGFIGKNSDWSILSPKIYFAPGCEYHGERYQDKDRGKVIWYAGGILDRANIYASHRGVDEIDRGQYDKLSNTDFATGCCMLIKREVVDKIGLFDPKYYLYYEDVDYSVRAVNRGLRVIYSPNFFLWHKNAASSQKPGSPLHVYYQTRNRLYFGFKYSGLRTRKSLFLDSIGLMIKGGPYFKAVRDFYLGAMEKGSF